MWQFSPFGVFFAQCLNEYNIWKKCYKECVVNLTKISLFISYNFSIGNSFIGLFFLLLNNVVYLIAVVAASLPFVIVCISLGLLVLVYLKLKIYVRKTICWVQKYSGYKTGAND